MALIPYEPFRQLDQWRRDIDRFFNDNWHSHLSAGMGEPRIDVYEKDNEIIAACEIPGLAKKEDVSIDVDDNMLTISGSISQTNEVREEQMHRRERFIGRFQRTVSLPGKVLADQTQASYRNGVLEIRMPKARSANSRRIDVDFN